MRDAGGAGPPPAAPRLRVRRSRARSTPASIRASRSRPWWYGMLTVSTTLASYSHVTSVNIDREDAPMPAISSRRRLACSRRSAWPSSPSTSTRRSSTSPCPTSTRQLGASTRDLQWIVDGYNLAFAALVLAGGSIGDRFGRRPVLIVGLVGFAAASAVGAACARAPGTLIAVRFAMGACAALIYPTTLSIITNAYPDRERAGQGHRRVGRGDGARRGRRARSPAGCCWPTSGGAACSWRWCRWRRWPRRWPSWSCPSRATRRGRASTCPAW